MALTATSARPPLPRARRAARRGLPGDVRASVRVPWVEAATYLALVPAAFVPVLLATSAAAPALLALAGATGGVAAALAVQRVVVGDDYVAVRRLRRYRVVPASAVTAVRARPSQRGGSVSIEVAAGRPLRLRHVEAADPATNAALCRLAAAHGVPVGDDVARLAAPRSSVPARTS